MGVVVSAPHDTPIEGTGNLGPGDAAGRSPGRHFWPVVGRPTGTVQGGGRLSADAAHPLRDGRYRHPTPAAPRRAPRGGLSGEEPLAGGPCSMGCRLVPVDRRAWLLV